MIDAFRAPVYQPSSSTSPAVAVVFLLAGIAALQICPAFQLESKCLAMTRLPPATSGDDNFLQRLPVSEWLQVSVLVDARCHRRTWRNAFQLVFSKSEAPGASPAFAS